jgi:hypothetical protein
LGLLLDFTPSVRHRSHVGDETVSNFREAFRLLIELLQLQVEQFTPDDPLLNGFAETRFAVSKTLYVETL